VLSKRCSSHCGEEVKLILITKIPVGVEVMIATAYQGSICKQTAQYKCYFKNSHLVVCHVCQNTGDVLCCLNSLLENKKEFAMKDKLLLITCGINCLNKLASEKKTGKKSNAKDDKGAKDASRSYVSWLSDNPSKPDLCSMNILIT
jgi:hypothetical protein